MTVKRLWFVVSLAYALGSCAALAFSTTAKGDAEPQRDSATAADLAGPEAALVAHLRALEAKRRKARSEALKEPESWARDRPARAAQHRQQLAEIWGNGVGSIDAQASLRMNADRMARLNRMLDLAEQERDAALIARLEADITRELTRHAHTMAQVIALSGSQ